jgi:hypothetical protein
MDCDKKGGQSFFFLFGADIIVANCNTSFAEKKGENLFFTKIFSENFEMFTSASDFKVYILRPSGVVSIPSDS